MYSIQYTLIFHYRYYRASTRYPTYYIYVRVCVQDMAKSEEEEKKQQQHKDNHHKDAAGEEEEQEDAQEDEETLKEIKKELPGLRSTFEYQCTTHKVWLMDWWSKTIQKHCMAVHGVDVKQSEQHRRIYNILMFKGKVKSEKVRMKAIWQHLQSLQVCDMALLRSMTQMLSLIRHTSV